MQFLSNYNLENVMLSDKSQTQKAIVLHLHKMSKIGKSVETEKRRAVSLGWGLWGRNDGMTAKEYRVSCWGDENVLKSILVIAAQLREYTKNCSTL